MSTSGPNRPQLLGPEDLMETGYGERVLTTFPNKKRTKLSQKVAKNPLVERNIPLIKKQFWVILVYVLGCIPFKTDERISHMSHIMSHMFQCFNKRHLRKKISPTSTEQEAFHPSDRRRNWVDLNLNEIISCCHGCISCHLPMVCDC